eukprot:GHVN01020613.1.p1 GENE.GHVN01020613.1~~GHVN01020613.1.p1  ORF type:complete len:157 (-),score=3.35 GHVN01020613.1:84-491(-)
MDKSLLQSGHYNKFRKYKKTQSTKVCSRLRLDRSGAAIQDMLFAWAFAVHSGFEYLGPVGESKFLEDVDSLLDIYGLPFKVERVKPANYTFPIIRQTLQRPPTSRQRLACVVHLRRGDVTEKQGQKPLLETNAIY